MLFITQIISVWRQREPQVVLKFLIFCHQKTKWRLLLWGVRKIKPLQHHPRLHFCEKHSSKTNTEDDNQGRLLPTRKKIPYLNSGA
jgi:hypothetical protein